MVRVARKFSISGDVQGVGYRFSPNGPLPSPGSWLCEKHADGTVEVLVEGPAETVELQA